ncbi:MAG TPA: FtsH protease activity modulator HflK [Steroidobacteraceae bacterium]|nr:FtsH protease activity modulator HflK [Steroidobacteraceae bacterium]
MAWNQPGEEKKRPPPRGAPDNASLDELLRRLRRQVQQLWRPGSNRATAALALVLLIAALWLISGYYQISPSERGVVQRFGRYVTIEQPGHGWHWPWPIETMTKLDVTRIEALDSKALMLTDDEGLIDVSWSVQYRIADPLKFLFQVRDPQESLRQASETIMRELVAASSQASLADGEARPRVAATARGRIQQALDTYGAGVNLVGVNLADVRLPDPVQSAQRDAVKAAEDRQHARADAEAYRSDIVPKAQSAAQRQLSDAQGYATQTRAAAEGEAQRFTQLAQAYARAPAVTRSRMYIDTMESILAHAHKLIIDTKSGTGSTIYVPLDKLAEAIRNGSRESAAPAALAGPAAAAAASAGGAGDSSDDARNRERPER